MTPRRLLSARARIVPGRRWWLELAEGVFSGAHVAQAIGADNRESEMPPQRDRVTMARRVRGYVMSNNRSSVASAFSGATDGVNARERKALATMGRKGEP